MEWLPDRPKQRLEPGVATRALERADIAILLQKTRKVRRSPPALPVSQLRQAT
jgi:hypothetical protein